jgi:hypothetical protein
MIEREDWAGMHLTRHGNEPKGGGRLRLQPRERNKKENYRKKEPASAAGGSRDVYHSVLYVFAACCRGGFDDALNVTRVGAYVASRSAYRTPAFSDTGVTFVL